MIINSVDGSNWARFSWSTLMGATGRGSHGQQANGDSAA